MKSPDSESSSLKENPGCKPQTFLEKWALRDLEHSRSNWKIILPIFILAFATWIFWNRDARKEGVIFLWFVFFAMMIQWLKNRAIVAMMERLEEE